MLVVSLQVPAHLQNSWESYYMEILMVTGLLAYIMNYLIGKNKNSRLAQAWFDSHRELLESNFSLVGELSSVYNTAACESNRWHGDSRYEAELVLIGI